MGTCLVVFGSLDSLVFCRGGDGDLADFVFLLGPFGFLLGPFGSFWVLLGSFGSFWVLLGKSMYRTCSEDDFPVSFSNAACRCKEVYGDANARKGYSHISIFTMDLQRIS